MIKSFKDKETEKVFSRHFSKKLPQTIQRKALGKLWMIDSATRLADLPSIDDSEPPSRRIWQSGGSEHGVCRIFTLRKTGGTFHD